MARRTTPVHCNVSSSSLLPYAKCCDSPMKLAKSHPSLIAQSQAKKPKRSHSAKLVLVGWREMIDLPDLPLLGIKAKIDTGARTSALHATHIEAFEKDSEQWVRFRAAPAKRIKAIWFEVPLHEERAIKNTGGVPEDRYVIRTRMRIGSRSWMTDVSLADRSNMTFEMIVGRAALKDHAVAVHTRKSFLLSQPVSRKDQA